VIFKLKKNVKKITFNLLIIFISVLIPIISLELFLRFSSSLHQLDRNDPSYIPYHLKKIDKQIYENGGYITKEGFRTWRKDTNNLIDSLRNDVGCKIVALGDSFVMGDGLRANQTWPAKLEKLSGCYVYPFGQNGWSSLQEFQFYQTTLINEKFDYLIVGVVSNDPHPRGEFCNFRYDKNIMLKKSLMPLNSLGTFGKILKYSYVFDYFDQVLSNNTIIKKSEGSLNNPPIITMGYQNWINRMYERDIYTNWEKALACFSKILNHKTAFLLTPRSLDNEEKKIFTKIYQSMENLGLRSHNTFADLKKVFGEEINRKDWANLADPHPGPRMTSVYAKSALGLIRQMITENQ